MWEDEGAAQRKSARGDEKEEKEESVCPGSNDIGYM